jgi:hypothetical protein
MAKASDYRAKSVLKETLARDLPSRRRAVASASDARVGTTGEMPSTARQAGEGLQAYRERRDFGVSPEPKGRKGRATGFRFVVQKHDARRLLTRSGLDWTAKFGPVAEALNRKRCERERV